MHSDAAQAHGSAPMREIDWRKAHDQVLIKPIADTVGQWSRMLKPRDMLEAVKSDVHAFVTSGNMRPLRAFDPRHGTLANWLSRIAHASATQRLHAVTNIPVESE